MSTDVTKASIAGQKAAPAEESPEADRPQSMDEGPAVFRGLLVMIFFYIACGCVVWLAWYAFRHWRGH